MKKYILYLAATILMGHLLVASLLSYRYWIARDLSDEDITMSQITKYQEQKIQAMRSGEIDTIFLGDSSLGNAINARIFDKLAGTRSLNLALTGGHGHAGALVFLREVLERQPALKNVILFFAVDGMGWGLNPEGRFYMSYWPIEPKFSFSNQWVLLKTYLIRLTNGKEALSYLQKITGGHTAIEVPSAIYNNDYFVTSSKISVDSENVRNYRLPQVTADSTRYLEEIGLLCKERQLNCIYIQGPLMAELLKGRDIENKFFATVSTRISQTGIKLANDRPFLMTEEDRGDTIFHLAHTSRDKFTARYVRLIAPMLETP